MELIYLQEKDIETMRYISFFEMFHGAGSFQQRRERIHWYFRSGNFKLLVAVADNRYVGQSCSYKTTAIIHGKEQEWWWGVDSFVLEEMRGRGIGKALQKKLHEDCPNFSSASYSSLNGIIKKKCGGHEILDYHRYYCPVSCWLTLYSELVLKKVISRKIAFPRIRLPYCYSLLNRPQATGKYTINELVPSDYNDQLSSFVEECLRNSSFHIHRSNTYLRWKYLQNPSIKYIGIEIKNNGQREAVVFFTDVYKGKYTVSAVMVSKILDAIILPESSLTQKMLLSFVVEYFRKRGTKLDGLLTLIPSGYWPQIQYPASHPSYMLSTLHAPLLENGYLAYSDQDMEQIMSIKDSMDKTKIIINADDCGLSKVVNEHIEEAILQGKITSTTIMANMEGFEGAVALSKKYGEQISFGWHANLTQGAPLLYSQRLLDRGFYVETEKGIEMNGRKFLHKWLSSEERDEIRKELMAQYQKLRDSGIQLSHIDSHHHVHTSIWAVTVIPDILKKTGLKRMRCMFNNMPMSIDLLMRRGWASFMGLQVPGLKMPDVLCNYEQFMKKGQIAKGSIVELECHPGNPKFVQEEDLLMKMYLEDKYTLINYNQL